MRSKTQPEDDRLLRLLLIGSLPPPLGGTAVSFTHLIHYLETRPDVTLKVINTQGIRSGGIKGKFMFFLKVFQIFISSLQSDVISVHIHPDAIFYIGPFIVSFSFLLRKPFLLRIFAGVDYNDRKRYGRFRRTINHFVARRAQLVLIQTKMLLDSARADGLTHVQWFPTNRPMPATPLDLSGRSRSCRRFVFLGQLRWVKGVAEIIQAGERFGEDITIDVYGPLLWDVKKEDLEGLKRIRYHGEVKPECVHETLYRYDALLLPTFLPDEGYSGVIMEAYGAGLPDHLHTVAGVA